MDRPLRTERRSSKSEAMYRDQAEACSLDLDTPSATQSALALAILVLFALACQPPNLNGADDMSTTERTDPDPFIRTVQIYIGHGPRLVPGDETVLGKFDLIVTRPAGATTRSTETRGERSRASIPTWRSMSICRA